MLDQLLDRLRVRIGVLLHHGISGETRGFRLLALDDAARDADDRRASRYFFHHDRVRADARPVADGEAAEDLGARADHDARAQCRVALLPTMERRATERHAL